MGGSYFPPQIIKDKHLIAKTDMLIPADVPLTQHAEFGKNYDAITHGTDRLFLFAADHKIEHLDTDFYGLGIDSSAHNPEHIFKIASNAPIGALATQLGLITRYGNQYPGIPYVAKLNSKTNLVPTEARDPVSKQLWNVDDVIALKKQTNLCIAAVGITIYIGSEYENMMLAQAAQTIFQAHQHGLVTIIWVYPRGKAVSNSYGHDETDPRLLAGAVGVAACLGADFVKIHPPKPQNGKSQGELLRFIKEAAGNTNIICAGGKQHDPKKLLEEVHEQLTIGGIAGAAIGRNIYQHSMHDAVELCSKLAYLIYTQK